MIYGFVSIVLIVLVILCLHTRMIMKIKSAKLYKSIVRVNLSVICSVILYIAMLMTTNERAAYILLGLHMWCDIIFAYSLFLFVTEYTRFRKPPIWFRLIYYICAVADLVIMFVNVFRQSAFLLHYTMDRTGIQYYSIAEYKEGYGFHSFLMISAFIGCIWLLFRKACSIAGMYRMKYLVYILTIILIGFVDATESFFGMNVDLSILFWEFGAFSIYYFCYKYVPFGLKKRFMSMIIKESDDGIVFFDLFGTCQYENAKAKEFFSIWDINYDSEKAFNTWISGKNMQDVSDSGWETKFEKDGKNYFFHVDFKQLYDNRQKYLGCFFLIHNETEEREKKYEEFRKATRDELTGLYNRDYFFEQTTKRILDNQKGNYCVICCDILDFKVINDMFGATKGDELLLRITDAIKHISPDDAIYGRIGSDRFAVCMNQSEFDRESMVGYVSDSDRMTIADSFQAKIYIGVYENITKDVPISVACDRTILAINTIKGDMRTSVVFYDEIFRKQMLSRQQLTSDFNQSIRDRKFHIYLQSHVSKDGRMFGAEALVRWFHPIRGMILPQEFIPVFEQTGLISRLDMYVWELACRQLRRWKEMGLDDYYISVNISERDMYYIDIYETLTNLVEQHEIDVKNLRLEITEMVVVQDVEKVISLLNRLREYGFYIYMDNFGSGYSSLNMLKDLPLDTLKLDMDFLNKAIQNEKNKRILDMIVSLSHRIGLKVITEGIETEEQLEYMHKTGCTQFQGFYFSRPLPVKAFEEKYLR